MSPFWTFFFGLVLLILFGWYFATDIGRRKRVLGSVLTLLIVAFCLSSVWPPFDVKDDTGKIVKKAGETQIHLGLDLQGGTSFLLRLVREGNAKIDKGMLDQAVGVIDRRINQFGVSEPVIAPQGEDRILVQIPAGKNDAQKIEEAREQLQKVAKLELKLVHPQSDALIPQIEAGAAIIPPGYAVQKSKDVKEGKPVEERLLVKQKADLEGGRVAEAHAYYDNHG